MLERQSTVKKVSDGYLSLHSSDVGVSLRLERAVRCRERRRRMQAPDLRQVKLVLLQVSARPRADRLHLMLTVVWHEQLAIGVEAQDRGLQVREDLH